MVGEVVGKQIEGAAVGVNLGDFVGEAVVILFCIQI